MSNWPESWLTERGYAVSGDRATLTPDASSQPPVGSKPTAPPGGPSPAPATGSTPLPGVHAQGEVAALDLATRCGWAVGPAERIRSGVADFGQALTGLPIEQRHGYLFMAAEKWITSLLLHHRPALLVVEDSGSGLQGDATRVIVGLRAIALLVSRKHGVPCRTVPASQWKAWAKGLGWTMDDKSDERDARWLLRYWVATGGMAKTKSSAARHAARKAQGQLPIKTRRARL